MLSVWTRIALRSNFRCTHRLSPCAATRIFAIKKRHLYAIARGSAMECAAVLDVMRIRGLASAAECRAGRALLVRIVQMLTKLEQSLS